MRHIATIQFQVLHQVLHLALLKALLLLIRNTLILSLEWLITVMSNPAELIATTITLILSQMRLRHLLKLPSHLGRLVKMTNHCSTHTVQHHHQTLKHNLDHTHQLNLVSISTCTMVKLRIAGLSDFLLLLSCLSYKN